MSKDDQYELLEKLVSILSLPEAAAHRNMLEVDMVRQDELSWFQCAMSDILNDIAVDIARKNDPRGFRLLASSFPGSWAITTKTIGICEE